MINSIQSTAFIIVGSLIFSLALASLPSFAHAASYAYVDIHGEVKTVVANNWQSAITLAPDIHINSGVLLLNNDADFSIVGNDVEGAL